MTLTVNNLSFAYSRKSQTVLSDVSFSLHEGDLMTVLGPNGVGKSTLFRCILGFLTGYKGNVLLDDTNIKTFSQRELAKKIAYIPQSTFPVFNLTLLDVVLMGMTNQIRLLGQPKKEHIERATKALESLGIGHLKNAGYAEISGGERQLALIARALVQEAKILIMDEPTANLDYGNQTRIMRKITDLATRGYSIIISTHNPDHSFFYANRILIIRDSVVIADGIPDEELTQDIIKKVYGIDVDIFNYKNSHRTHKVCIPADV